MKKNIIRGCSVGLIVVVLLGIFLYPSPCPTDLDEFIECQMKQNGILGAQFAVVDGKSGDLLFEKAYGFTDRKSTRHRP